MPGADARPAGHGVGRRDERIGAVVEVEEHGLRALEQHVLARLQRVVDEAHGVGDHRLDPGRVHVEVVAGDLVGRQREAVVDLGQDLVLLLHHQVELLAEDLRVEEVLHPQADAGGLVGVGGADAALGRAELVAAEEPLAHAVELLVVRHDQVGVAAHPQAGGGVDAPGLEAVDLVEEHLGVDDDAVADDVDDLRVEDAARDQLEGVGLPVDDDGVAGVVAALVADDHRHLLGEEVGQLALALVPPLGSHDHRGGHDASPELDQDYTAP